MLRATATPMPRDARPGVPHSVGAVAPRAWPVDSWERAARGTVPFLALSLALHAMLVLAIVGFLAPRRPSLTFELPSEVELGFVDAAPGQSVAPALAAPDGPRTDAVEAREPIAVAVTDAPTPPMTDEPEAAAAVEERSARDASGASDEMSSFGAGFSTSTGGGGFGVAGKGARGTMIVFQADLDRIRASSLASEAGTLLDVMPGWQHTLAGSGLEPSEHFRRVFVATPDLGYERLVVSAAVRAGAGAVREAAARVGQAGGAGAPVWAPVHGVQVAPWRSGEVTPRVVALVGGDQLAIVPTDDLRSLLGVAAALGARNASEPDMERARGGAALLAMHDGEALAVAVEGARQFVVGATRAVPLAVRLSVRDLGEFNTEFRATGLYQNASEAKRALSRVDSLRRAWGGNPRAATLGLRSALEQGDLTQRGNRVELRLHLTLHQARYVLELIGQLLRLRAEHVPAP